MLRIFLDFLIFFIAILIPGWSFFVLASIASYFYDNFFEIILTSFLVDILYGFPIQGFYGFRFVFFSLAVLVFMITRTIRKRVRKF